MVKYTPEQIKLEVEKQYDVINNARKRIKELRSICEHKEVFKGNYTDEKGATRPAVVCSYCGKFIQQLIKVTYINP